MRFRKEKTWFVSSLGCACRDAGYVSSVQGCKLIRRDLPGLPGLASRRTRDEFRVLFLAPEGRGRSAHSLSLLPQPELAASRAH